jgi:beta-mannosidase
LWFGWFRSDERDLAGFAAALPRMVRFVSAFGAQSVPFDAGFMAPERWPDLDWEGLAHRHSLQTWVMDQRVPAAKYTTFDGWRDATQRYQADLVRHYVEHLRRLKYKPTGGFCVSSLADGYPAVTWSLLDHARVPKAAYHALTEVCRPVIVAADRAPADVAPGTALALDVHVVSDLHRPLEEAEVVARLSWPGGSHGWRWHGEVPADACVRVGTVSFVVPDVVGRLVLDLDLVAGDLAATNRYESEIVG